MGIFDGLMSWGSSVLNTVSSFASTVFSPVTNLFTGGGSPGGGSSSPGGGWVSGVQQAFTNAVTQATKQVEQITSSLNDTLSGIRTGFDDFGKNLENFGKDITANLPKIFDAESAIQDAQKQFDRLLEAGGNIPANLAKQFEDAKKQVAEKKKEIKTQTDNYAKDIVQKATAAAETNKPIDAAKVVLSLNPLTMPFVAVAGATKTFFDGFGNPGGSTVLNPDNVTKPDPNLLYNLDYGNPNVQFYGSEVDEQGNKKSTGYLGQYAKPFSVTDDAVWFNTGGPRGGSNAPAGMSSWTDTPDSQKLHNYGLNTGVIYTSHDISAADQARLLATYKENGWLPQAGGKTVTERAATALENVPLTSSGGKVVYKGIGANTGASTSPMYTAANGKTYDLSNPATALNVVADAIGGAPAAASGLADGIIGTRNEWIAEGAQSIMSGNIASVGTVKGAVSVGAEIIAPLDLMNVVNLWMSGRGDQIELEDLGYAALDAVALGAGAVTGGAGYIGIKALKGVAKGAKVVKYGSYVGQAGLTGAVVMGE